MNFRQWLIEYGEPTMGGQGNTFSQGAVGDYKDGNNGMKDIRSKWQQKEDEPEDCEIGSDMGKPEEIFGFRHKDKSGRNHDEMLRLGVLDQKKKFMKKMNK